MIRHIVLFKMVKEVPADQKKNVLSMVISKLDDLPEMIPEILSLETGINTSDDPKAADIVMVSEFRDPDSLLIYLKHPAHKAFIDWNRDKCPKLAVADYEF